MRVSLRDSQIALFPYFPLSTLTSAPFHPGFSIPRLPRTRRRSVHKTWPLPVPAPRARRSLVTRRGTRILEKKGIRRIRLRKGCREAGSARIAPDSRTRFLIATDRRLRAVVYTFRKRDSRCFPANGAVDTFNARILRASAIKVYVRVRLPGLPFDEMRGKLPLESNVAVLPNRDSKR